MSVPRFFFPTSSSLRPGTKGLTCGKWIIGYNLGIDNGAELKTHEELNILNILKYKYCVKSHDMSRDSFAKSYKSLTNW